MSAIQFDHIAIAARRMAVEFASARPLSLPQTPHPLLGTSFRRVTA